MTLKHYVTAQTQTQTRDLQLELKRNRLEFEIKAEVNFTLNHTSREMKALHCIRVKNESTVVKIIASHLFNGLLLIHIKIPKSSSSL